MVVGSSWHPADPADALFSKMTTRTLPSHDERVCFHGPQVKHELLDVGCLHHSSQVSFRLLSTHEYSQMNSIVAKKKRYRKTQHKLFSPFSIVLFFLIETLPSPEKYYIEKTAPNTSQHFIFRYTIKNTSARYKIGNCMGHGSCTDFLVWTQYCLFAETENFKKVSEKKEKKNQSKIIYEATARTRVTVSQNSGEKCGGFRQTLNRRGKGLFLAILMLLGK